MRSKNVGYTRGIFQSTPMKAHITAGVHSEVPQEAGFMATSAPQRPAPSIHRQQDFIAPSNH